MIYKKHSSIVTKVWLCLLALGLLALLAACGGGDTGSASSTPTAAPTPTTAPTTAPTDTPTTAPAPTPTTAPTGGGNSITIASFAFSPASLTVKVGTKVTWTNND